VTSEPSGRLYSAVTKHWPRIAGGLVVVLGLVELVAGGLTADSGVEFYLMAWAGTTGGVWFLFEKAEKALSEESREKVVVWMGARDVAAVIDSIPSQFAMLFDRVFGSRHLSRRCFLRSCLASGFTSLVLFGGWVALHPYVLEVSTVPPLLLGIVPWLGLSNLLPDYLSLWQTRFFVTHAVSHGRLKRVLVTDFLVTTLIAYLGVYLALRYALPLGRSLGWEGLTIGWESFLGLATLSGDLAPRVDDLRLTFEFPGPSGGFEDTPGAPFGLFFYASFLTSAWLWLYALSVPLSRVLLRMNSGVGFLLRVTDVERQPFRSMGFVSVIIVSVLFALGLPLVLL
jgi:hypothetical protein